MEIIAKTLLFFHISSGFISLVLFWLPVFLKKGGKGHRNTGKAYVFFMWIVVGSAALLSIKNVIIGQYFMASFLGFIALITANPLWYGIAILKKDKVQSKQFRIAHTVFDAVIVVSSVLLVSFGIYLQSQGSGSAILMIIFGSLGLLDIPSLIKKLKGTSPEIDPIRDHMIGLLTSGIAAYSAFFVFGAHTWVEKLLPGMWAVLPWTAPGVIGAIGITCGVKYFRKKGMIKDRVKPVQTTL
jgi:uncharacterized membrane protein